MKRFAKWLAQRNGLLTIEFGTAVKWCARAMELAERSKAVEPPTAKSLADISEANGLAHAIMDVKDENSILD